MVSRERHRLYESPDYALVTTKAGLKTLEKDMESLVDKGGFYYEVFEMQKTVGFSLMKKMKEKCGCRGSLKDIEKEEGEQKLAVVLFADDSILDLTAEVVRLQARLNDFDCRTAFKAFARSEFERFTGREVQGLLDFLLDRELDLPTLEKNKVVLDKMYLHEPVI